MIHLGSVPFNQSRFGSSESRLFQFSFKREQKSKNRYAMRTCVCYLKIIVGYVVLTLYKMLASLVLYGVEFVSQL